MHFAFTAEQTMLRDAVRALLEKEHPAAQVRASWSDSDMPPIAAKLAEMGVFGMLVPEAHGGLGLTEIEALLVLEELGRAAAPDALVDTMAIAAPLLREAGETTRLDAIARGASHVVVVSPTAPYALDADRADAAIVLKDEFVHLVPRRALDLVREPSVDGSRRLFRVHHAAADATCLASGPRARALLADATDRAALALSAQLLGLARRMLDTTVEYAKTRTQFGRPIGSFQAVKHHLADALVSLELARPVVHRAAWSIARRVPERSLHASMAKALASDAAVLVSKKALQCHGAIGYAFENDLHLWMKRAWARAASWGDAAWHRARAAQWILPNGESA